LGEEFPKVTPHDLRQIAATTKAVGLRTLAIDGSELRG
jgi:hypothetical protein